MAAYQPLSDTESSASSSPPPVARPVKRRRGRPKKIKPEYMVFSSDSEDAVEPAQGALVKPPLDLADLIRPTGGGACNLVGAIIASDNAVSLDIEPQDAKVLQAVLGVGDGCADGAVNSATNPAALARLLGVPRQTVQRRLPQLAMAAWAGARGMVASCISALLASVAAGELDVVSTMRFVSFDETPLPVRVHIHDPRRARSLQSVSRYCRQSAETSKVFQAEMQFCVIARDRTTEEYASYFFSFPCPLMVLERGTASCLVKAIDQTCCIPHLSDIRKVASSNLDFSCADRASANGAAENILNARCPDVPRCRLPCLVHCVSIAQGRSWNVCAADITGAIATALAMGQTGQVDKFRECMIYVLISSVKAIVDCEPLPPEHPQNVHLSGLLKLCLPPTRAGLMAATDLYRLLSSDVRLEEIKLRVPGGEERFDVEQWAFDVSCLLLPVALKPFQRHRWCNSLEPISGLCLLTVHNLLPRAGLLWQSGKPPPTPVLSLRAVSDVPRQVAAYAPLSDSDEEALVVADKSADTALVQEANPSAPSAKFWQEWTKNNGSKTVKWLKSSPCDRLLVMRLALLPCVCLLNVLEHVAGEEWQAKQWSEKSGRSRVQAAADGVLEAGFLQNMQRVFTPQCPAVL